MRRQKTGALVGLALSVAVLGPASASANVGGTDRPVSGTASGTVSLNLATGGFSGDVKGVTAHLGKYSGQAQGTGAFAPDRSFAGVGMTTIVAANGDQLTGTSLFVTSPFTPTAVEHTTTQVTTITGGTGRFDDATGTITTLYEVSGLDVDGATLLNRVEGKTTGRISY